MHGQPARGQPGRRQALAETGAMLCGPINCTQRHTNKEQVQPWLLDAAGGPASPCVLRRLACAGITSDPSPPLCLSRGCCNHCISCSRASSHGPNAARARAGTAQAHPATGVGTGSTPPQTPWHLIPEPLHERRQHMPSTCLGSPRGSLGPWITPEPCRAVQEIPCSQARGSPFPVHLHTLP